MASISFLTFQQFVDNMISRWGSEVGIVPVLVSGDPLLATFQAAASQMIMMENFLQDVVLMARLSTSTGSDVDSFVADFGLSRLPAIAAEGQVTFATASIATSQILIPVGTIVQTQGGAIQYAVIANTNNPAYNSTLQAYVIQPNQTSVTASVQATVPGSIDNVQAGQLTQFGGIISGVATVTNSAAITNGLDAETDSALKARFVLFFAQLSKATLAAILFAVNSVQQGLDVVVDENVDINLNPRNGFFIVVVDDGSGNPPSTLLNNIFAAVNAIRAFTITFAVIGPTIVTPTIAMSIHSTSATPTQDAATAATAILNYVNSLPLGTLLLERAQLVQVALQSSPTLTNVNLESVLIDGLEQDLVLTTKQEPRIAASNITVTNF